MNIVEAGQKVFELRELIDSQQQLIDQLRNDGKETTSANIVLDSLRMSLSLEIQNWHIARRDIASDQIGSCDLPRKSQFDIVSDVAMIGRESSMAKNSWFSADASSEEDEIEGQFDSSLMPADTVNQFELRPLTEEEKKEFTNRLDAKGKRLLGELEGKKQSSDGSAAA